MARRQQERAETRRKSGPWPAVVRTVSFDCFGTLIDWERGLSDAIARVLGPLPSERIRALVASRGDVEWNALCEMESFTPYREILATSLERAAGIVELDLDRGQAEQIAASIREWPPFPDAREGLARIAARHPVALVSNVDRCDIGDTMRALGIESAHAVCADDVACYKPEPDHLMALMHELKLDEHELLHVSAYPEYDLRTARDLGIACVFVDRGAASAPEDLELETTVPDIVALAGHLKA